MKIYRLSSKLASNESQQDIASDSKFLEWFNGSKAVDQNGNPQRVFHGTNQQFSQFGNKYKGRNTQNESARMGFFFTEDPSEAKDYADLSAKQQITDQEFVQKKEQDYLKRIENAERARNFDLAEKLTIEMEDLSLGKLREEPSGQKIVSVYLKALNPMVVDSTKDPIPNTATYIKQAIKGGYDSVHFVGISDNPLMFKKETLPTNHWVVFSPKQIWVSDHNFKHQ